MKRIIFLSAFFVLANYCKAQVEECIPVTAKHGILNTKTKVIKWQPAFVFKSTVLIDSNFIVFKNGSIHYLQFTGLKSVVRLENGVFYHYRAIEKETKELYEVMFWKYNSKIKKVIVVSGSKYYQINFT